MPTRGPTLPDDHERSHKDHSAAGDQILPPQLRKVWLMEISREQAQTENGLMIFSENKPWVSLTTGPGSPIMEWDGGVGQDQPRKDRGGAWSSPGRVTISTTTAAY